ncbi:MAG TPA: hypothetical protein VJT67_10655 [Longimicrobiaceae bacterium]|nr:hypothetical protein [Longimicrobiaceae bacterium]
MSQESMTVHAGHPEGHEGYVLLLYRPDAEGRVRWREWSSDDYVGPPREGSSSVDEIVDRVAQWNREGWSLSESVHLVTSFLGAS